jgi:hypothetical protein
MNMLLIRAVATRIRRRPSADTRPPGERLAVRIISHRSTRALPTPLSGASVNSKPRSGADMQFAATLFAFCRGQKLISRYLPTLSLALGGYLVRGSEASLRLDFVRLTVARAAHVFARGCLLANTCRDHSTLQRQEFPAPKPPTAASTLCRYECQGENRLAHRACRHE